MPSKRILFSAIVGQEIFKRAYLANIVNPCIGGLLVSGPKGTGKSTIVHSAHMILPEYHVVEDCIFNCDPKKPQDFCSLCKERSEIKSVKKRMKIISLPLSCTEDRLIGSIDIEKLLKKGVKEIVAGILGEANRNILYVDEVNLLPDHLVDDILDAAALHWNTIEREGISIVHRAEFVLIGTMNPEEGDLRPQILDRFPLCVKIRSVEDSDARVLIVKRNLLFENDPAAFNKMFSSEEKKVAQKIIQARRILNSVVITDAFIKAVADSCAELKVDGQRPDIVIIKTALTLAALDGRIHVKTDDILFSSELALVHRTRDGGLLEPPTFEDINNVFSRNLGRVEPSYRKTETVGNQVHETQKEENRTTRSSFTGKVNGVKKN